MKINFDGFFVESIADDSIFYTFNLGKKVTNTWTRLDQIYLNIEVLFEKLKVDTASKTSKWVGVAKSDEENYNNKGISV